VSAAAPPRTSWRARLDPARLRLWAILVPLHLVAFLVLYFGTLRLLERAYADAGAEAARQRLDLAVREMPFFVPAADSGNPHVFDPLIYTHAPIGLRLFGRTGNLLGSRAVSADPDDMRRVAEFLATPEAGERVWVESDAGRETVRGLHRIVADSGCAPCHATGEALGVATLRIDYTEPLARVRRSLRLQVGVLIGAWILLLGSVTLLVQRSARRSAARLEAELAAVSSGTPEAGAAPSPGVLVLDPVAAEVHRGLGRLLERQREREQEVVTRLAHVDQLASLGQLAAGLAHEIKNPLAGIHGALEVLRDETPEGPHAGLYGEMLGELRRVNGILQQLLESGRPAPLRATATDLGRLLADSAELMSPSLRRRGVTLQVEVAGDLPPVAVDAAKIRQVLVNLIQNAAEAMPEGGHVDLRASRFPEGEGIVITVADDGPGMSAEVRDRIFEPFFSTKFTGTGLGLAITRSLVAQHGGRLDCDSEPGRGTTFFVMLPESGPPAPAAEV